MPSNQAVKTAVDAAPTISEQQIADFNAAGFLHIRRVLDPQLLAGFARAITAKVEELSAERAPAADEAEAALEAAFLQVMNLRDHDDVVRELVFLRRLAGIAAQLLGVDHVRLYHDQALYKEPGGEITPWHADQAYFPIETDRTCTVWIPLQDTPVEMGALAFSAGSHRVQFGRDLHIGGESETLLEDELSRRDLPYVVEPYAFGDVSYHLGWTFHRAGANTTEIPRRAMTMIYVDADARVSEPKNDEQRYDHERWLGAVPPGSILKDEFNPILY